MYRGRNDEEEENYDDEGEDYGDQEYDDQAQEYDDQGNYDDGHGYEDDEEYNDHDDESRRGGRGGYGQERQRGNHNQEREEEGDDQQEDEEDRGSHQRSRSGEGGETKKRPRDYSDNYTAHRFSDRIPAVELPMKVAKTVLQQAKLEASGSAHRHCFTFFGYAQRKTTHAVKKQKPVLVLMTYESIVLCDATRGDLLRIIPLIQLENPVYCVLDERILHLKVQDEHDAVLQFQREDAESLSHPIDILCDQICDLQFLIREEDLLPDETVDMIEKLEVSEIPTSTQLVRVNLKRPPHVNYPSVRMKELLRYENPPVDEEEVVVPPNAVRQIPPTLAEIPGRQETFVTHLGTARKEDLAKQLALLQSQRLDAERELDTLDQGNKMLDEEYQTLNMSVQSLRTAVQLAYRDAEQASQRKSQRAKKSALQLRPQRQPQQRQQQQQMKWERGSDEDPDEESAFDQQPEDEPYDEEDLQEEDEEGEDWDQGSEEAESAAAANDKRALNNVAKREVRILDQKLKVVKLKLMQAQEQASRLWTRTDKATGFIELYQEVLLGLEFVAQEAAIREAGATQSKPELEKLNRDLRMELRALKLLDQVSDDRDAEVVKAETDVALRRKVLQDKLEDEDKLVEDAIRPQRIEHERHFAEVAAFFEAETEKAAARAAVEFHRMHTESRKMVHNSTNSTIQERVHASITHKVSTQLSETRYLRAELQRRASFVSNALVSLRDENEGVKRMLNNLMKQHAMSQEAHSELRTRLLDTQRSLAEERDVRKEILERTKDQIVTKTQDLLRKKELEISRATRILFELQDSLQRVANTFGLGHTPNGKRDGMLFNSPTSYR